MEDKSLRAVNGILTLGNQVGLPLSVSLPLKFLDGLQKFGYGGVANLVMRKEFMEVSNLFSLL